MKYVFALWATPLVLFWGWYFLSFNDMHFGYVLLTRQAHDLIFQLYGQMLGIDPTIIPGMVAKACVLDTFILLAIWAFRRRKTLIARARDLWTAHGAQPVQNALQDEGRGGRIDAARPLLAGDVHLDQGSLYSNR